MCCMKTIDIKNRPKSLLVVQNRVGAPGGGKFHFFYWRFLRSAKLRKFLFLRFDYAWDIYFLLDKFNKRKLYYVRRYSSHKWFLFWTDSVFVDYRIFNNCNNLILFLECIVK